MSGAVISGYDAAFEDPAYHSNYDRTIDVDRLLKASSLLARSLVRLALDSDDSSLEDSVEVDSSLVASLTSCFTEEGLSCRAIAPFVEAEAAVVAIRAGVSTLEVNLGSSAPSLYTSVLSPSSGQPLFVRDQISYARPVMHLLSTLTRYCVLTHKFAMCAGLLRRGKRLTEFLCILLNWKCLCVPSSPRV